MRKLNFLLILICAWLLLFGAAGTVGLVVSLESKSNIQTLLLNGKTASAVAAKKTAAEVKGLEDIVAGLRSAQLNQNRILMNVAFLVNYVRKAQTQGQQATAQSIGAIEQHFDSTIRTQIHLAGVQVEHEVIQFNESVLIPKLEKLLAHK